MEWFEVTINTTHLASELVCDIFFENGGNGVAVYDNDDIIKLLKSERNWDYADNNLLSESNVVLVKGFIPADCFDEKFNLINDSLNRLKKNNGGLINLGSLEIIKRKIGDEDWINVWKKHYKPVHIKNVTVCPVWIDYKEKADKTVIKIDPGMAFGTGEHETTTMCIDLLQEYDLKNKAIIDVGCGSGILGLTAVKLNCLSCYMTDIDPVAKEASEKNAKLNNVGSAIIKCGNLLDDTSIKGDLIIINIVADVLINFSKDIKKHLNKNGILILSGIINQRAEEVFKAYSEQGFILDKKLVDGEWTALALKCRN